MGEFSPRQNRNFNSRFSYCLEILNINVMMFSFNTFWRKLKFFVNIFRLDNKKRAISFPVPTHPNSSFQCYNYISIIIYHRLKIAESMFSNSYKTKNKRNVFSTQKRVF